MADKSITLATEEYVDDLISDCSPAIVTASDTGKAISIPDSSESAIKGLTAYGESVQDGAPTPDSPVEIVSVENPVINVYGKNLFDPQLFINGGWSSTGEGVYSGLASVLYRAYPDGLPFKFEVGKKYTFSFDGKCDQVATEDMSLYFIFNYTDGSNTTIRINSADFKHYTATSTKDVKSLALAYNKSIQTYIKNFQLEISSAETPYEPYKNAQTVTVPYTFRGLKNSSGEWTARDELRVGDGKVEIVRNVGIFELQGTEVFTMTGSSPDYKLFYTAVSNYQRYYGLCNYYKVVVSGATAGQCSLSDRLYFGDSRFTAVADFKSWLSTQYSAGNPVVYYYSFETAAVENITATEAGQALLALKSNYPTTSVISDIDLNITYKADTKNYIDNKIAALTALTLEG